MTHAAHRRIFGLLMGAAAGLIYGLVSQCINPLAMPGIPFYQPPFGTWGNLAMAVLLGAVLGLTSTWPETGFSGVLWSSLLGSLAVVVATLLSGIADVELLPSRLMSLLILFVPIAAALSPAFILFRWVAGREEITYLEVQRKVAGQTWLRAAFPATLLLLTGAIGLLSLYPELGRAVTPRMDALIRQGLQAKTFEELPKPLQHKDIGLFLNYRVEAYTLQWDKDDQNQFALPRPATDPFYQSTVIARFANGYRLVCMYPSPTGEPRCKDFLET